MADTRRKIELGGLVIKAGMAHIGSAVLLGALLAAKNRLEEDPAFLMECRSRGDATFSESPKEKSAKE